MNDFLYQGGYAFYVWSAYGVSAIAVAALVVWTLSEWRQAKARIDAAASEDTP